MLSGPLKIELRQRRDGGELKGRGVAGSRKRGQFAEGLRAADAGQRLDRGQTHAERSREVMRQATAWGRSGLSCQAPASRRPATQIRLPSR